MKDTKLAYLAGLIEADGSFTIGKSLANGYVVYDPLIRITSTYLPTVKWLVDTFGGSYKSYTWDKNECWKKYYVWKFSSDVHASRVLDSLLPFLWLKKPQALILKEYYYLSGKYAKEEREFLFHKMKRENQNEPVTTNTSRLPLEGKNRSAYFAGLFDGEGSAYIIKVKQSAQSRGKGVYYRPCVCLGMTHKSVIDELNADYGGSTRQRPPHNGVLPMYEWDLKSNDCKEKFLLDTLPYMITKREQAKLILENVRMRGEANPIKRAALFEQCSLLNGNKRESDLMGDHECAPVVTQVA